MKTIYLAGGCFWGVEHFFSLAKGIINTEVGYANGTLDNPKYEDPCSPSGSDPARGRQNSSSHPVVSVR